MKKIISILTLVLLFFTGVTNVKADEVGTLSLNNFEIKAGETVDVDVILNSTIDLTGIQADFIVPEGFSFVALYDEDEEEDIYATIANSEIASKKHEVGSNTIDVPGHLRVLLYSTQNKPCTSKTGIAFTIHVKADENVAPGTYNLGITDMELTETDGETAHYPANVNATMTVPAAVVYVSSITLNETSVSLTDEEPTFQLVATVAPENATTKELAWSSSNTEVVTVDQTGLLTYVGDGDAIITVKTTDGSNLEATCSVNCANGIFSINADTQDARYFTPAGQPLNQPQHGVNIMVLSNGKVVKVIKD